MACKIEQVIDKLAITLLSTLGNKNKMQWNTIFVVQNDYIRKTSWWKPWEFLAETLSKGDILWAQLNSKLLNEYLWEFVYVDIVQNSFYYHIYISISCFYSLIFILINFVTMYLFTQPRILQPS